MFCFSRSVLASSILALSLLPSLNLHAQGFKSTFGTELKTTLKRKLAAYVNINKKRIKISAITQGSVPNELAEILKEKFQTELQKDTNFVIDPNSPETILTFAANSFYGDFVSGSRDDGTGKSVSYTRVSGNIQVSYTATEARTNAPIDSENLEADLRGVFPPPDAGGGGMLNRLLSVKGSDGQEAGANDLTLNNLMGSAKEPPTRNELIKMLTGEIIKKMAQRAVPVEEQFAVLLPKGKLEPISKLAMTGGAWGKVLNETERFTPFPKAEDEAYRVYLLGLANEALAYEQANKEDTRNYLFEARKHYSEAKNKKPKEAKFLEPYTRVDKALIQYDRIIKLEADYQAYLVEVEKKNKARGTTTVAQAGDPCDPMPAVWNNQMLICQFKQNTSAADLIALVKSEPSPRFDASSTEGFAQLKNAGIPMQVILAVRERMANVRLAPAQGNAPGRRVTPAGNRGRGGKRKP
jgi:hypothetical protein